MVGPVVVDILVILEVVLLIVLTPYVISFVFFNITLLKLILIHTDQLIKSSHYPY